MRDKFKAGDKVQQITGGPEMIVVYYDGKGNVVCTWFSEVNNVFKKETFNQDSLIKVSS